MSTIVTCFDTVMKIDIHPTDKAHFMHNGKIVIIFIMFYV